MKSVISQPGLGSDVPSLVLDSEANPDHSQGRGLNETVSTRRQDALGPSEMLPHPTSPPP